MRLIDADALIGRDTGIAWISTEAIEAAPTVEAITFPCPIGSDYWYVEPEELNVVQVKGGIRGFAFHDGKTLALVDPSLDLLELHDQWCCLSRDEAESIREKLLANK